jgi:hypothetical protein
MLSSAFTGSCCCGCHLRLQVRVVADSTFSTNTPEKKKLEENNKKKNEFATATRKRYIDSSPATSSHLKPL